MGQLVSQDKAIDCVSKLQLQMLQSLRTLDPDYEDPFAPIVYKARRSNEARAIEAVLRRFLPQIENLWNMLEDLLKTEKATQRRRFRRVSDRVQRDIADAIDCIRDESLPQDGPRRRCVKYAPR